MVRYIHCVERENGDEGPIERVGWNNDSTSASSLQKQDREDVAKDIAYDIDGVYKTADKYDGGEEVLAYKVEDVWWIRTSTEDPNPGANLEHVDICD